MLNEKKISAILLCILLSACGGGGGSDDDGADSGFTNNGGNTGGTPTSSGDNGGSPAPAYAYDTSARFNLPNEIKADRSGNLYVLELKAGTGPWQVRRIAADGSVTTLPKTYSTDPTIALDASGNLYVKDGRTIHRFLPGGEQTSTVEFNSRPEMAVDSQGNVYLRSLEDNSIIFRKISPSGESSVFYSQADEEADYFGIAIDGSDNLYSIRAVNFPAPSRELAKFSPQGERTIVGPVDLSSTAFASIPETVANLDVDAAGNVYIASYNEHRPAPGGCLISPEFFTCQHGPHESGMSITKVTPAGVQTDIRTGPPGSTGQESEIEYDADFGTSFVAAGPDGNLYATYEDNHTVYRITQSGEATLYAGKAGEAGSSD